MTPEERDRHLRDERDRVHRMVTLIMDGDRAGAALEMEETCWPGVTALVACEGMAYLHKHWARGTGMTEAEAAEAWQALMLDMASS